MKCIKMNNIDIYNNSAIILKRKTPKIIISWITILITSISLLIIFSFVPFNIYKTYGGYITIENDNSYINLFINESDFPIYNNYNLYIKNTEYSYEVISISHDELKLELNLEDKLRINNNYIFVNILESRTTLFKIIKEKIKKGFGI